MTKGPSPPVPVSIPVDRRGRIVGRQWRLGARELVVVPGLGPLERRQHAEDHAAGLARLDPSGEEGPAVARGVDVERAPVRRSGPPAGTARASSAARSRWVRSAGRRGAPARRRARRRGWVARSRWELLRAMRRRRRVGDRATPRDRRRSSPDAHSTSSRAAGRRSEVGRRRQPRCLPCRAGRARAGRADRGAPGRAASRRTPPSQVQVVDAEAEHRDARTSLGRPQSAALSSGAAW